MKKREVLKKINNALDIFYQNDKNLLKIDVQERAIAHRLAAYLESLFEEYDVDCEYDKHGKYTKKLEGIKECDPERKTNRILPDILIHKRENDNFNLVVFEVKSKTDATPCDIKKLKLMTKNEGEFKYKFGILVRFRAERDSCEIDIYVKGRKNEI